MADKPTEFLDWATDPEANVQFPNAAKRAGGWDEDDPRQNARQNAILKKIDEWLKFLDATSMFVVTEESIANVTEAYLVVDTKKFIVVESGSGDVTLPAAPVKGEWYVVISKVVGPITIQGNGNLISGNTSIAAIQWQSQSVFFDGTDWLSF